MKHSVILNDGKSTVIYNSDLAGDLAQFLAFFGRVLTIIKPWDAHRASTEVTPTPVMSGQ